jgi:hypothetical protein
VDEAMELKGNADQLYASEIEQRKSEVESEFSVLFDRTTTRQNDDLEQLNAKLKFMLREVAKRREVEFAEQTNQVIVALKFHLQKAIADVLFLLEAPARRGDITKDLTSFLREKIKQQQLTEWLVAVE